MEMNENNKDAKLNPNGKHVQYHEGFSSLILDPSQ